MDELIGRKVTQARWHDGCIYLDTEDQGWFKLEPQGDCCAQCYIQHVAGTNALPGTISAIENVDSSTKSDDYDNDMVSESWGHLITTDRGHMTIECRVDHNGYYSGWVNTSRVQAPPNGATTPLDDF